jgi:hypothetical protein
MFLNGRCQIFNNGELVDYDIVRLSSYVQEGGNPKRNYSDYKGKVLKKDLKLLDFNKEGSVFIYIPNKESHYYNQFVEFTNCILKKQYPYKLPFLSKWCWVIIHIPMNNKTNLHDSDKIFRKDKINKIISGI